MNYIISVLTPWTGSGIIGDSFRPLLVDRYQYISCVDVTDQPCENLSPDPNLFIVEIIVSESVLNLIVADPDFYILSSEVI